MPFSLLQPLLEIPIAVVDVETTGASADFGHSVIEIGIVRIERGERIAEYQQLLDPQRRIGPGITALTGITQAMVNGQPRFVDQIDRITELLSGAAVMGHNIRFDLSFLNKEFRRCGRSMPQVLSPTVQVLDTVRIARRRFGRGGNGLGNLARRLGIEPVVAHRALADAQTTHLVFERLIEPVGGWSMPLCDVMREQGGPMGLLPINPRESILPLELEEALEQRKPVLMVYLDARQQQTQRIINPLTIRRFRGELLLVAHCHLREDRRTFKVERIVELKRIDGPIPVLPNACDDPPAPSPGTPGEGGGEGDFPSASLFDLPNHPHPDPQYSPRSHAEHGEDQPTNPLAFAERERRAAQVAHVLPAQPERGPAQEPGASGNGRSPPMPRHPPIEQQLLDLCALRRDVTSPQARGADPRSPAADNWESSGVGLPSRKRRNTTAIIRP